MSLQSARTFLEQYAPDLTIIETAESTATVALAAQAHQVEAGQIAKTLCLRAGTQDILLVMAGDVRLDNKKLRQALGVKAKMHNAEETLLLTGHPVGGVCPFGLATPLTVYCDISLRRYPEVMPAVGSINSAVKINPEHLAELVQAQWIDVAQDPKALTEE